MQKFHGWLTLVWAAMMPLAIVTGWIQVVVFVAVISIYANMMGHWSSWQSARVEVKQQDAAEEVVAKMVEKTTVEEI